MQGKQAKEPVSSITPAHCHVIYQRLRWHNHGLFQIKKLRPKGVRLIESYKEQECDPPWQDITKVTEFTETPSHISVRGLSLTTPYC